MYNVNPMTICTGTVVLLLVFAGHVHGASRVELLLRELEELLVEERGSAGVVERDASAAMSPGVTALVRGGHQAQPFRIGAFNVQIFGDSKFAKPVVRDSLLDILPRYDILLFQEIRDSDNNSFPALMNLLNEANNNAFAYVMSERAGRSSSKEQYAYIYKVSTVNVEAVYTYPDPEDHFERPPFGIKVSSPTAALGGSFGVLGVHTKPDEAESEIDHLVDVYDAFTAQYNVQNVVLLGDFNAGCSYVTQKEWPHVRLRTDSRFTWLIPDDMDTTTSNSDCPYDRIVLAGSGWKKPMVPHSAGVYRFDQAENLDIEATKDVSDHYPVEFVLYGKVDPAIADVMTVRDTISIEGINNFSSTDDIIESLHEHAEVIGQLGFQVSAIDDDDSYVTLDADEVSDVIDTLSQLSDVDNALLPDVLLRMVQTYIEDADALAGSPVFPGIVMPATRTYMIEVALRQQTTIVYISKVVA